MSFFTFSDDIKNTVFEHPRLTVPLFLCQKLCVWCRVTNGQWHLGKIQFTYGDDDVCVMLNTDDVSSS